MRPLTFLRSLLFFGIPAILFAATFWGLLPLLDLLGFRLFVSFLIAMGGPPAILLFCSFRFYKKEGNVTNWPALRERFRLGRMNINTWLWTLALASLLYGALFLLDFTRVPKILTRIYDPDPNYLMEVPLRGNWIVVVGALFFVTINVAGQELWWRGYVLPRQELTFGKWTWAIHGLFWLGFQMFWPWEALRLLPGALALPFVAQKLKSTWPGIISQFALAAPWLAAVISNAIR